MCAAALVRYTGSRERGTCTAVDARVCVNHQSASKAITAYKEFPGHSPYALAWALNPTATTTTR
jgi:hypothetical protein